MDHVFEQVCHLLSALVNGRHHHVTGRLMSELNDPFTKVRLDHLYASCFKALIEKHLLGDHALALRQEMCSTFLQQTQDDLASFGSGRGLMDLRTRGRGARY